MEITTGYRRSGVADSIATLDLVPAHYSLVVNHGWDRARIEAADHEYRLFLHVMREHPRRQHVPSPDADLLWHEHILTTERYAADCRILFGRFLHHYPFAGRFGRRDALRQRRRSQESQAILAEMRDGPVIPDRRS